MHIKSLIGSLDFQVEQAIFENTVKINPDLEYTENQIKYMNKLLSRIAEIGKMDLLPIDGVTYQYQLDAELSRKRMIRYIMNYEIVIAALGIEEEYKHANFYDIIDLTDSAGNKINFTQNESFYFSGIVGSGKTYTGICLLLQYYLRGMSVKYIKEFDFIEGLRILDMYEREKKIESVKQYEILLIDDFGMYNNETDFITKTHYRIFDYRHNQKLITLTTSNYLFNELFKNIKSDDMKMFERTISRMAGLHKRKVELNKVDRRIK